MLHTYAIKITSLCIGKQWIDAEDRDWCIYTVEKWIMILLFFSAIIIWMVGSGKYIETIATVGSFYAIRRRAGGYHAPHPWICLLTSATIVIASTTLFCSTISRLPCGVFWGLNLAAVTIAIIVRPEYPPQANFSASEKRENTKRKNILLFFLLVCQLIVSVIYDMNMIVVGIFVGINIATLTVIIEKITSTRRKIYNEKG